MLDSSPSVCIGVHLWFHLLALPGTSALPPGQSNLAEIGIAAGQADGRGRKSERLVLPQAFNTAGTKDHGAARSRADCSHMG
jgi:hypothetical protein